MGKIFLEILNSGKFPRFPEEKIQDLVRALFEHNEKDSAKIICNLYAKEGIFFLKEIHDEYLKRD